MSSLSNLPYGKILDYWYEKLAGSKKRLPFILTKTIEVFAFQSTAPKHKPSVKYSTFSRHINCTIPAQPIFALVVPCYIKNENDLSNVQKLMSSIEQQTRKPDFVIFIDDCSPIKYDLGSEVIFVKNKNNTGPAKARNIGKEIAKKYNSDIIAFTDSDCVLSCNWVSTIIKEFQNSTDYHILSGNTIALDKHWFGTYHNMNGTLNGRRLKASQKLLYGTTANLAISSIVNEAINFNEDFPIAAGEDIEFCFRANQNGFAIRHIPSMTVQHNFGYNSNSFICLRKFIRQFRRYSQGEKTLLKHVPDYYSYFDQTHEITTDNS